MSNASRDHDRKSSGSQLALLRRVERQPVAARVGERRDESQIEHADDEQRHGVDDDAVERRAALTVPRRRAAAAARSRRVGDGPAVPLRVVHGSISCDPIRPNHQLTDPTQPDPLQVKKFGRSPTQYN